MRKWSEIYFFFFLDKQGKYTFEQMHIHVCFMTQYEYLHLVVKMAGWMEQTPNNDAKHLATLSETLLFPYTFSSLFLIPFPAFANQLLSHSITVIICCSLNAAFHCTMIDSSKWVFLDSQSKCVPAWHSTDTRSKRLFVRQVPELHRKLI